MTIYEIAELAGVSISTVSRVLNEKPGVGEKLRKKVEKIIEENDYKPSLLAQGLTGKTMNMIGVVMPGINSYFTDRIEAINSFCKEKSYGMMITTNHKGKSNVEDDIDNFRLLLEKKVDGIIYFPTRVSQTHISFFKEFSKKIPIVITDREIEGIDFPCVIQDAYSGAKKIMEHLLSEGYKNIAFIKGVYYDKAGQERNKAYEDALREANIEYREDYVKSGDYSYRSGEIKMQEFIDELGAELPDAVFAANDYIAAGVSKTLHRNNIKIPEEVAVVGYDNVEISQYMNPAITTIDVNQYEIGEKAVKMLFSLIKKEKLEKKKIVVNEELIIRESSKK